MERKVTIQDFIDSLGMAGLLTSIGGEQTCRAVMAFYTCPQLKDAGSLEVRSITYNSKEASEGSLFVVKGANFKDQYLNDAIEKGAVCYVKQDPDAKSAAACSIVEISEAEEAGRRIKEKIDERCLEIMVSDIRKAMPVIAETFYGKLSDRLCMVGITGTKGKSTTAYYMRDIFDDHMRACGRQRSAICSGIVNYDGVTEEESSLTTPEIMDLYKHMYNALKSGISHMTMEVSSQALKYDRVSGIDFEAAAFLNIGRDHISDIEHPDFDDYLESKLKIFKLCRKACINLDCEEQDRIREAAKACPYVISFSQKYENADVFAYDIRSEEGKVSFRARGRSIEGYEDFDEEFSLGTFGSINVENALAAISLSVLTGVPLCHVKNGLAASVTPGRMEAFYSGDGKRIVIVDYAHNKLSFEKFYETVRAEFPGKTIISVFGATGGKGLTRRTDIGKAAGRSSDHSIITEDDPGSEKLEDICAQIAEAVESEGGSYEIVYDRPEAVRKAIGLMDDDTLLFIAGKGREHRQKRGKSFFEIPSDVDLVKKYLK